MRRGFPRSSLGDWTILKPLTRIRSTREITENRGYGFHFEQVESKWRFFFSCIPLNSARNPFLKRIR